MENFLNDFIEINEILFLKMFFSSEHKIKESGKLSNMLLDDICFCKGEFLFDISKVIYFALVFNETNFIGIDIG